MASTRACLISLLAGSALAGCTSSSGDPPPEPRNPAFVHVTWPTTASSHTAACSVVALSGDASISETGWGCCGGSAAMMTGVTVTWHNAATGQVGVASQTVEICSFFSALWPCQPHEWFAGVPLVVGSNLVTVTATDVAGYEATDTIDVYLAAPTFAVSGAVRTQTGEPLWDAASGGVAVTLDDGWGQTRTAYSGADGVFRFGCVASGGYTLSPSDTLAYPFTPASRAVTVAGADVAGQDFSTIVHAVTGHVQGEGAGFYGARIGAAGALGSTFTRTNSSGDYRLLLPDGTWTLTPEACGGFTGCQPVLPPQLEVTVAGADVPGNDFQVQYWP